MVEALFTMVLAAVGGSLLTVAGHRSMTRIDRVVLASIATASLLLGVCLLNDAVPGLGSVQASGGRQASFGSSAAQPATARLGNSDSVNG